MRRAAAVLCAAATARGVAAANATNWGVLIGTDPTAPEPIQSGFGYLNPATGEMTHICKPDAWIEASNERVLVHHDNAFRAALMGVYQGKPLFLQSFPSIDTAQGKVGNECGRSARITGLTEPHCPLWALVAGPDAMYGFYFTSNLKTPPVGHVVRVGADGAAAELGTFPTHPGQIIDPTAERGDCILLQGAGVLRDNTTGHLFFYFSGILGDSTSIVELDVGSKAVTVLRNETAAWHAMGLVQAPGGAAYGIGIDAATGEDSILRIDLVTLKHTVVAQLGKRVPELGATAIDVARNAFVAVLDGSGAKLITSFDLGDGKVLSEVPAHGVIWALAAASD